MSKIGITTGDLDGVGLEIALKALQKIKLPKNLQVDLYCGRDFEKSATTKLKKAKQIQVIGRDDSPALWVEECARACMDKSLKAVVTGPLSKPEIKKAGLSDLGHTEIFARISGHRRLYMSFWGKIFNVVLITGHRPLQEAGLDYTPERIREVSKLAKQAMLRLDPKRARRPMALLGLNPHAGDQGLIGSEELANQQAFTIDKNLKTAESLTELRVEGPFPGDSTFLPDNFKKYGMFLAAYHDQGLIPFKLMHGFETGVHVTLGLPFLRTSVDHGPAKDLFGKNKADFGSMKAAIEMAVRS